MKKTIMIFIFSAMAASLFLAGCAKRNAESVASEPVPKEQTENAAESSNTVEDVAESVQDSQAEDMSETLPAKKYSLYKDNDKYGLIDKNKKIVLKAEYDRITYNDVYLCTSESSNIIYDGNLNVLHIFEPDAVAIIMTAPFLFYYWADYTWNLYNLSTDKVNESPAEFFEGNISGEPWIYSHFRYYSKDLQEQPFHCHKVYPYRSGRAVIMNFDYDGGWTNGEIIDEDFNVIFNHFFAAADYYSEGLLPVVMYAEEENHKRGKSCYVDLNGQVVYECDFDFNAIDRDTIKHVQTSLVIGSFNEDVAVVQKADESWVVLDREFNKFYLPENCCVESTLYSNGLLLVSKSVDGIKHYGYVDKECNVAIPFDFTDAESFDGNYAVAQKDGAYGVIDTEGSFTPVDKLSN